MAKKDETTVDKDIREEAPTAFAEEPSTSKAAESANAQRQQQKDDGNLLDKQIGGKSFKVTEQEATQLNSLPTRATATDAQGIERTIVPSTDPWSPNPVDPDPDEVARLEERTKALDAKRTERLAALGVKEK